MTKRLMACVMFGTTGDHEPFNTMGIFDDYNYVNENASNLKEDDTLIVWGGGDISPSLYNKDVGRFTGAGARLSNRDAFEWNAMRVAKDLGIPIIGVCRGAQMLCALAGGYLYQHVENHGRSHQATTYDGHHFEVSSVHHQMLAPWDVNHELIAWSSEILSPVHYDVDKDVPVNREPEMVYFPDVKGVAIQWHPEFMNNNAEATKYINEFLKERVYASATA